MLEGVVSCNNSCWTKTRSQSQFSENQCVCHRGHIFSPKVLKVDQNVCLHNIMDEFDDGSCLGIPKNHTNIS